MQKQKLEFKRQTTAPLETAVINLLAGAQDMQL